MSNRVVSIHYTMTDGQGNVIHTSQGQEPLAYIEGVGQVLPGLESAVTELKEGETKRVELAADQAFGAYDETQVVKVPKDQLPPQEIQVGDQFQADSEGGAVVLTVTEVSDTDVTMDGNHPLAGVDIVFDVEVVSVREATQEELDHGHVHGPDGHHH